MNQHIRSVRPPSEIENKIFSVLKSIPILKVGVTEAHCRARANILNGVVVMAHMNYQRPEVQQVGAKRTQAELKRISDLAEKIAKAMNAAHRETNALIQAALPNGKTLSQYKRDMNEVFKVLHQADVDAAELTAKGKKQSDRFAIEITRAAAKAFTALTGRKATQAVKAVPVGDSDTKHTSYGPFLDFLKELFEVLGVKASAEYHARLLRRNRS
jgi:hypothetical protein